ncbi:MAG: primosomal protein N' (replication factor Y) - superfamily II helicase [Gammaproteobacteria bacterium]|nr:primosomal protein N' (replication factor Y) - superfamily II helicase [Gammaproteobacteria bacterium]
MQDPGLGQTFFPCSSCGSSLVFKVGSGSLECKYCGNINAIEESHERIVELNFNQALQEIENADAADETSIAICINCSAEFYFDQFEHAGTCPYCNSSIVTDTKNINPIVPQAIAPFSVTKDQAKKLFQQWLGKLWFAPTAVKKFARSDDNLKGTYIPYWTFDSKTDSYYSGARGDLYYRRQYVTVRVNGRARRQLQNVPEIRWTAVSGQTSRFFDDVLVQANKTLPRKITEPLAPWQLEKLKPYNKDYISGFSSELYQISIDDGFQYAKMKMDNIIRNDVRRDIGGTQQQIRQLRSSFNDVHFKHILLPIWTSSFAFKNKTYRFAVNGQTGKVKGERPYSPSKIAMFSLLVLALIGLSFWLFNQDYVQSLIYGKPSVRSNYL